MNGPVLGYAVFRLTLGVNFFMHGAVRIFSGMETYRGFAEGIVGGYADTILPRWLLVPFAWSLPPIELTIGLLLIVGLFTRWALVACGLTMAMLVFGKCLTQDWGVVSSQMIYAIVVFLLLVYEKHNAIALDSVVGGRRRIGFK